MCRPRKCRFHVLGKPEQPRAARLGSWEFIMFKSQTDLSKWPSHERYRRRLSRWGAPGRAMERAAPAVEKPYPASAGRLQSRVISKRYLFDLKIAPQRETASLTANVERHSELRVTATQWHIKVLSNWLRMEEQRGRPPDVRISFSTSCNHSERAAHWERGQSH